MTGRLGEEAVRGCITIADIADLPTVDVPTAGRVLGIGRDAAYAAAAAGQLPTLRLGRSLRVPTAKLLTMLGASVGGNDPGNGEAGPASPATTSTPAPLKRGSTAMMTRQPLNGKVRLLRPTDSLDELAQHVDGAFVLVVRVTGGKYRRRCFLTAASAERAARNAQAAGDNAEVYLAELKPLWRLEGGTSS